MDDLLSRPEINPDYGISPPTLQVRLNQEKEFSPIERSKYIPLIKKYWGISTAMVIIRSGKPLYTPTHTFKM